jgi:diacylglycerol kinase (ATP)
MLICPPAQPDDGLFDVCVVSDLSRPQVLRLVPKLYSGKHVGHPAVELLRCRELSAAADRRVRCQADGELVGDLPAHFSVLPAALRCVAGPAVPGSST